MPFIAAKTSIILFLQFILFNVAAQVSIQRGTEGTILNLGHMKVTPASS